MKVKSIILTLLLISISINLWLIVRFKPYEPEPPEVKVVEVIEEPEEPEELVEAIISIEVEPVLFRVTAYCACELCCGEWAKNRPTDELGNPIVIGASNDVLITNVSVASPLPFYTEIELGELGTVVVHDRTAKWVVEKHGEHIIDIYMADHDEARRFGVQYIEGVVL